VATQDLSEREGTGGRKSGGTSTNGIADLDFLVLAEFAAVRGVVALGASYQPAWRATRVDPLVALRAE
jgi:ABC-type lipoprotein release transport system permease subunit